MTRLSSGLFTLLGLLLSSPASAEPTTSSKAAAEALYQQGTELVAGGNFVLACDKFAASQKLDPALGTVLRWADCLDRAGRTASSWALFREAAAIAKTRGESERERLAEERAGYLEDNLSKLELKSVAPEKGRVVRLDGALIPAESLNTPLPVDPGDVLVEVSAPGHKPWSRKVTVTAGPSQQALVLPRLVPEPRATSAPKLQRREVAARPSETYRTAGLFTGAAGLLGLGGGALFGLRAADLGSESRTHCQQADPNRCDATGYELRQDALFFADAATLSGAVGGALLLTGIGLFVFAPDERSGVGVSAAPGWGSVEIGRRF